MQTLEIKVPDTKIEYVKTILKKAGVTIIEKKAMDYPNRQTQSAMEELKSGKGKKFQNTEDLFKSI